MSQFFVFLRLLGTFFLFSLPFSHAFADAIRVSSKIDTEGKLLGQMTYLLLESKGLPLENKLALGTTTIVREALVNGEIDLTPEYTGNGAFFSKSPDDSVWKNHQKGYERIRDYDLKKHQLVWLKPSPANNTWAIAVRGDLAKKHQLKSMEDFARYVKQGGKVRLAASAEFIDSPIALPSFQAAYDFQLKGEQLLVLSGGNTAATIRAATEQINDTNSAMVYGTDGAIVAADLHVLDDTLGAQAVYAPTVIVRQPILQKYPQIKTILEPLYASLDRETLQKLNEEIQVMGLPAKVVAKKYLKKQGFIK